MPIVKKNSDKLKAFRQHGFHSQGETETQEFGICPFCGRHGKFYVNKETKYWDCKVCGREGGFKTFLDTVIEVHLADSSREAHLQILAKNRGLLLDTLLSYDVCYNENTLEYLIPVYYSEGEDKHVWDIRRCRLGKPLRSTSDCQLGIPGWESALDYDRIWLCEGEWDAMACGEMLKKLGLSGDIALGLPGAGVFKSDWCGLFQEKEVICVFDNDPPGEKGAKRTYKMLKPVASSLLFVHWGEERKEGFDLRDGYIEMGLNLFDHLMNITRSDPPGAEPVSLPQRSYNGEGVEAKEVYNTYRKWLYMPDDLTLDAVYGSIIANRLPGDPIWLFLVAPPGGTKTAVLESLVDATDIVYKNTLSARSLVSGSTVAGGSDPSLLPRLHEKILVIEDFTTILSTPQIYREEVFGILRSAYNGRYERDYGTGRVFRCNCHFGILTGVTPAIEHHSESFTSLGERFLSYYPPIPKSVSGRRPYLRQAQRNQGKEKEMREELRKISAKVLNFDYSKISPIFSERMEDRVLDLAQLVGTVRGVVKREKYGANKDITHEPFSELGTRLVKQFTKYTDGVARFRGARTVGEREFKTARRIGYGSVPTDRRKVLEVMSSEVDRDWVSGEIAEVTGMPRYPLTERILETLTMLGVVERRREKITKVFRIREDYLQLIENTEFFNKN